MGEKTDIAYVFPGQGAQSVGMGKELYESSSEAKDVFDAAEKILSGLIDVTFNGPQERLTSTGFCQPAIFTYSIAALRAFEKSEEFAQVNPRFCAGLSLGECTSLVACGALSFEDTLKLVERRSFFMEEATKKKRGKMAAVIGFDADKLKEICSLTNAEVANYNSPDQIVITGEASAVEEACRIIKEKGAKRVIPLDVSGAFHSSLMEPAVGKFEEELQRYDFQSPHFPILSNVDGLAQSDPLIIKENLSKQITSSVQWVKIIENIIKGGVKTFYEIGPGNVLKGLIKKIDRDCVVVNM